MALWQHIDKFIDWIGEKASYLNLLLVLLICLDVALRYIFSFSKNWIIELEWHLFSIIFLLGASYGLQYDKHVRVDIWYQKMTTRWQAVINIFGTLLFLLPWCYVIVKTSSGFAYNSYYMLENSPNPGGLPWRFVIKSVIPISFVLLALQGISWIGKNIQLLKDS